MPAASPSPPIAAPEIEAIFRGTTVAVVFTRDKRITRCNAAFDVLCGVVGGALVGQTTRHIFRTDAAYEAFAVAVRNKLEAREPLDLEWPLETVGNGVVRCRIRALAMTPGEGAGEETVWLIEDVHLERQQAEALRRTLRERDAVMKNAPVGIIFTANRRVTHANPEFCRMFGYSAEEAVQLSGRDLFPNDAIYQALGAQAAPRLSSGVPLVHETHMQRANGETFWAQLTAYVLNPENTAEGTIWMIADRSEAHRQARAIEQALLENQIILDGAMIGIVYVRNRIVERCNPRVEQIFGYAPGRMVGRSTREWYPSDEDFQAVGREVYPAVAKGQLYTHEQHMVRQNGEPFWCRLTGTVLDQSDPIGGPSIWVLEDTSERHRAEAALADAKALMQAVFDCAKVSIIVTGPDGIIRLMNATAEQWLGYRAAELVGKATPQCVHDGEEVAAYARALTRQLGRHVEPGIDAFVARALALGADENEWTYIRKDGSRFPVHLTTSVLRDARGEISGYIGVAVDITDRRRAEELMRINQQALEERVAQRTAELAEANARLQAEVAERQAMEDRMRQMAHYDTLTGLPNRNLLLDRMNQAVALARRRHLTVGVLFIDLDRFKQVNDTLGHDVGDQLLREVAVRMASVLREADTLARIGGDEFVLLAPEVEDAGRMAVIAEKIIAALGEPVLVGPHVLHSSPSIGIACFPQHGTDSAGLLRNADLAMYEAKSRGRNTFHVCHLPA